MKFETEVKQWGNSLALRLTAAMTSQPCLKKGTKVVIETNENELIVKPLGNKKKFSFPITEKQLLDGLSQYNSHADEVSGLIASETDF